MVKTATSPAPCFIRLSIPPPDLPRNLITAQCLVTGACACVCVRVLSERVSGVASACE